MPRAKRATIKEETPVQYHPQVMPSRSIFERFAPVMLVAIIILAFFVGTLWQKVQSLEKGSTTSTANTGQNAAAPAQAEAPVELGQIKDLFNNQKLIRFGDANRKALFVAVEDPSCPYCHIASGKNPELNKSAGTQFLLVKDGGTYVSPIEEMKKLVDSNQASLVYIYTPGHGNGEMGHKALLCAQEKGKFWGVHDLLYSAAGYTMLNDNVKNDKTKSQQLADFLKGAMSATEMKACLDSGRYDNAPTEETAVAGGLAVSGTPGFFVNTTRFSGAYSWAQMESAVTAALQ